MVRVSLLECQRLDKVVSLLHYDTSFVQRYGYKSFHQAIAWMVQTDPFDEVLRKTGLPIYTIKNAAKRVGLEFTKTNRRKGVRISQKHNTGSRICTNCGVPTDNRMLCKTCYRTYGSDIIY